MSEPTSGRRWPDGRDGGPEPAFLAEALPGSPGAQPVAGPTVAALQADLRVSSRAILGVDTSQGVRSLRQAVRLDGLSMYPALAVLALSSAQGLTGAAQGVLFPEIGRSMGFGVEGALLLTVMSQAVGLAMPIIVSRLIGNRPWRARALVGASAVYAVTVLAGGIVPTALVYGLFLVLDASTSAASSTVDQSLTMDLYPPRTRVRFMAFQMSSTQIAQIVGPGLVLALVAVLDLTWRGVYLVMGVIAVLLTLVAVRLRDPGFGRYDESQMADAVGAHLRSSGLDIDVSNLPKRDHRRLSDVWRGMWLNRPMRMSLLGTLFMSMTLPLQTAFMFYLTQEQDYEVSDLAVRQVAGAVAGLLGVWSLAPLGERLYGRDPRLMFRISGLLGTLSTISYLLLLLNNTKLTNILVMAVPMFFMGLTSSALTVGQMQLVRPEERHYLGSVFQVVMLGGTALGGLLLAGAVEQVGLTWAVILMAGSQVVQLALSFRSGDTYLEGLDGEADDFVEDLLARAHRAAGHPPAALECSDIRFSYGQVEVLHGVDLTVEEGEILALLGVNGSGKSTLLRLVAGGEVPADGTVRCFGYDVTYAPPERRVRDGVILMRGGQGVFGSLTVRQNLDVCEGVRHAPAGLAPALERFPALSGLLDRRAGDLSGGEAQMLALARVFLLRPRLLLIDELSLGLAPVVVADLLEHVRRINEDGTTVIVVEQSLNLAAQIADRAVFLEQGRVRFEGPVSQLTDRPDLARAVFLGGAMS